MSLLEIDQKKTDAVLDKVLGWIVCRWSAEYNVSLGQSIKEIYSSRLFEELMDYDNALFLTDPLELYRMFQGELKK